MIYNGKCYSLYNKQSIDNPMTNKKKTLFISDLHLQESTPEINNQFFSLLRYAMQHAEALYILGDLFEAWIGDDDPSTFAANIKSALKLATNQGLAIYIIKGNRDFLLGKRFEYETGCVILADETVVILGSEPILLMHGDTLCTKDFSYQKSRRVFHHPIVQRVFLWLPFFIRNNIAKKLRAQSKEHTVRLSDEMMDVVQEDVLSVMKKHRVKRLIHGHTHKPATHTITIDGQTAERLVLAAWHYKASAISWDASIGYESIDSDSHPAFTT